MSTPATPPTPPQYEPRATGPEYGQQPNPEPQQPYGYRPMPGVVAPFRLRNEVGQLCERHGLPGPVSALTGLWVFPGMLILVGPLIWFVKTNNALNEYWQGLGVRERTLV